LLTLSLASIFQASHEYLEIFISRTPVTTGTSVVAFKFNSGSTKGVIMAADTLGSYGSLARFKDCPRLLKVNHRVLLGAGGDYADYQYLKSVIEQKM